MRDPKTTFVEWLPVVVRGRRGPRCFAEALPSEDDGEHSGKARRRPTYAWGRLVGYTWSYSTGEFIPLHGYSFERGSNNEDL
jgi:hypothetical protein